MVLHSPIRPKIARFATACVFSFAFAIPAVSSAQEAPPSPAQASTKIAAPGTSDASAAPVAVASGVVRTSDGSPVPGATLRLVNVDSKKAFVSWTDESGKFEFPALPAGRYTVEASQLGFNSASLDLELGVGPVPPPLQFVLRVATLAELAAAPERSRFAGRGPGQGAGQGPGAPTGNGATGAPGSPNAAGAGVPGGRGGRGQQLPPGLLNAVRDGLATGGFQQTDL